MTFLLANQHCQSTEGKEELRYAKLQSNHLHQMYLVTKLDSTPQDSTLPQERSRNA